MTDIFEEVSAELRRDRMSEAWDKYGRYIIGTAIAIVVLTSANIGYSTYSSSQNEAASLRYDAMQAELADMDSDAKLARLAAFGEAEKNGYGVLARFAAAHGLADANDGAAALAAFDALADDGSVPDSLRDYADLQSAIVLLDTDGALDDIKARLEDLLDGDTGLQAIARETLALAHMRDDQLLEARALFQAQINDAASSSLTRERAEIMLTKLGQALAPNQAPVEEESAAE